ncbi:MAG: DUF4189 domain-containing protein [Dongiaceae bacterium]
MKPILAALALAALAAALAPAARADCVSDCQAATYCDSEMTVSGECSDQLNRCYQRECNRARTRYGAIAWGPQSTAFGFSYDYDSKEDASRRALRDCAKRGDDCKVVAIIVNGCAALASAADGSYSVSNGTTDKEAQQGALAACAEAGGKSCEVQVWTCNGR